MGRKPNQAIRHFFERGPKLNDNSNRYQQTCKRCGERYEKGRQEALVAHIAKSCQGVSAQEREQFISEVSYQRPATKAKKLAVPSRAPTNLPELSGLEALAEVSRHHGQQSLQNDYIAQSSDFVNHGGLPNEVTHAGSIPGTQSTILPIHTTTSASSMLGSITSIADIDLSDVSDLNPHLQLAALRALGPPRSSYLGRTLDNDDALVDYSHGEAPLLGVDYSRHAHGPVIDTSGDSPEADDLVDYTHGQGSNIDELQPRHSQTHQLDSHPAAPENQMLDPSLSVPHDEPVGRDQDQMRLVAGYVAEPSEQTKAEVSGPPSSMPTTVELEAPNFQFQPILDSQVPQFQIWSPSGAASDAPKKVRGAFAPDRRTAVKEVRQKGACLRCRMLKKSCDSADPCKECAKLENARMWKGQCVRTRLAQIFNVFSSTLFMGIAHKTVERVRALATPSILSGRLEVSYFSSAGLFMTFPCLRIAAFETEGSRDMINTEEDGIDTASPFGSKFTQYGSRLLSMHYDESRGRKAFTNMSTFMHHTLKLALTMSSRILIARAIDLWICVTLLTTPQSHLLAIHEPRLPPTVAPVDLGYNSLQHGAGVHYVYIQLRRKLERACDVHFRAIMTELEKSLIQRKQADNFETFIGTVILLRCLEMVGYMYKGFDHFVDPNMVSRKDILYGADSWPLENPPGHYWQQGERFSDLLGSMLRLRKVSPGFKVQDGRIRAGNDEVKTVREWFDAIDLRIGALTRAREKSYDEVDMNTWEFRWVGKLFEV